ncbi:hypothetical protein T09_2174 [Trichinella sp. T9]|nr:hypothetical protein T09_2174 [Trichinella sp. T9]
MWENFFSNTTADSVLYAGVEVAGRSEQIEWLLEICSPIFICKLHFPVTQILPIVGRFNQVAQACCQVSIVYQTPMGQRCVKFSQPH